MNWFWRWLFGDFGSSMPMTEQIMDRWEREGPAWQIKYEPLHGGYDTMEGE